MSGASFSERSPRGCSRAEAMTRSWNTRGSRSLGTLSPPGEPLPDDQPQIEEVNNGQEDEARDKQAKPRQGGKFKCRQQHRFPVIHGPAPSAAGGRHPLAACQGAAVEIAGRPQCLLPNRFATSRPTTQKPTRRKDSSVHAAAIRNASIKYPSTLRPTRNVTSTLRCRLSESGNSSCRDCPARRSV